MRIDGDEYFSASLNLNPVDLRRYFRRYRKKIYDLNLLDCENFLDDKKKKSLL